MGAVLIGEEEGEFKKLERSFVESVGEEEFGKVRDELKARYGEADDEVIYRYRYFPE